MVTGTFVLGPEFDLFEDDTEESVLGSSSHQGAIVALDNGLTYCCPLRGLPWLVANQLTMLIPRGPGRPPVQTSPDILVHPTLTMAQRPSLDIGRDGPPALVIEVVSPSTALGRDLNTGDPIGKPRLYAAAGIREYLVFDPFAEWVRDQVRAWHLSPRDIALWLPDERGHWVSAALGVSFAPRGPLLRVYDQDGQLAPLYGEAIDAAAMRARQLADRERQIASLDQRLAERDQQVADLLAEIRRLRGE